jgi:hypothetical protein
MTQRLKGDKIRKFGLDLVGDVPWGTRARNAHEIIDAIKNHQFALIKRRGRWELIESTEKKRIADDLLQTEES